MDWHCAQPDCEGVGWRDDNPVSHCWRCGALGKRGMPPNLCSAHRIRPFRVPRP